MTWEEEAERYRSKKMSDAMETCELLAAIAFAIGLVVAVEYAFRWIRPLIS
jgi:hypothetical protein